MIIESIEQFLSSIILTCPVRTRKDADVDHVLLVLYLAIEKHSLAKL